VISGQKAAWVSNGTIADIAVLFCTLDQSQGFKGGAVLLVPLDLPGISRPRPVDKLGQRSLNQGEIFFDGVRIPSSYMALGPELYAVGLEMMLAQ
jgi:alkylation response protein AidB-like acyl-CoA dehydrogenase